jgi:hypothetical protein
MRDRDCSSAVCTRCGDMHFMQRHAMHVPGLWECNARALVAGCRGVRSLSQRFERDDSDTIISTADEVRLHSTERD